MIDEPVKFTPLTKSLRLRYSGEHIVLPPELQAKVDAYWQTRVTENPHIFNGEAFTVVDFQETPNDITVELSETNFAHNLYSEVFDAGEYTYRVIHSACLVITADNKLVVGKMQQNTARPGAICCSGGGIDRGDLRGSEIDLEHSTAHELREELGIDPYNNHTLQFFPAFLKTGGYRNKITVLYELHTALTSKEFAKNYAAFVATLAKQGEDIEYEQLFYVDNTPQAVEAFIAEHSQYLDAYLPALFRTVSAR